MSVITPQSEVYLIKCPIESDNNHQLTFANPTAQLNYFKNLPHKHLDNFTFIRKDGVIRFPVNHEELLEYNYVMYKNDAYENKWIFAFVLNQTWINNGLVELSIETDAWQTWQFDITFKRSLIEREHVNDDTVGLHTYPENLEYGEYVCNNYQFCRYTESASDYKLCVQVTDKLDTVVNSNLLYNRVFQGCFIFATDYTVQGCAYMQSIIGNYDDAGKGEAIVAVFVVPSKIILWQSGTFKRITNSSTIEIPIYIPVDSAEYSTLVADFEFDNHAGNLNGYSPRNGKLLTAPYNYFTVSSGDGNVADYKFEDFIAMGSSYDDNPHFEVVGALTQGGQIKCVPRNYRLGSLNDITQWDYGVNGVQYPILSWKSDYYLNWRARNSQYIDYQNRMFALKTAGQIAGSIASGGEGASADWFGSILDYAGERWQQQHVAEITPASAKGNINCGDLTFAFNADRFTFKQMTIRAEYARKIDDFLSVFGYKTMRNKVPNITGRRNWNFVKTIECNIEGDIPSSDMQSIKGIFNKGVTLWHNPTTFMDYSQDNSII